MAIIRRLNPESLKRVKIEVNYLNVKKNLSFLFKIKNIKKFSFVSYHKLNSIGSGTFLCCRNFKHIIFKKSCRD